MVYALHIACCYVYALYITRSGAYAACITLLSCYVNYSCGVFYVFKESYVVYKQ